MKTATKKINVGNLQIEAISEVSDGKLYDTKINIGTENLCYVSGQELEEFLKEFQSLIDKYRI